MAKKPGPQQQKRNERLLIICDLLYDNPLLTNREITKKLGCNYRAMHNAAESIGSSIGKLRKEALEAIKQESHEYKVRYEQLKLTLDKEKNNEQTNSRGSTPRD